jgi:5-formyltetrahydrofolate cyclo-ligase
LQFYIYGKFVPGGSPQGLLDTLAKDDLRREILAARKLQTGSQIQSHSSAILESLVKLDAYRDSQVVALYYPFKNEVDLRPLLTKCDKTFVFPKVVKKTRKLDFYKVSSVDDLNEGAYGIMEPQKDLEKVEIADIDLFAVPGVAFSELGERIGYGGGYYDSTLIHSSSGSVSVGIAFNIQLVKSGFSEEQDIPVDILITEKNIYFCNERGS